MDPIDLALADLADVAREIIDVAEGIHTHRAECERIGGDMRRIMLGLTSREPVSTEANGANHEDSQICKDARLACSELRQTLADLRKVASREEDHGKVSSPSQGSTPHATSSGIGLGRRALNAVRAEFGLARAAERADHAVKTLTKHALVPPAYDSPATKLPDHIPITVWGTQEEQDRMINERFYGTPQLP